MEVVGVVLGRGGKLVGVMLGAGGGLLGVIGVMFGGGGVLVRVVGVRLGGGGEVVGVVGLMFGWGVGLCFLQARVHRPIIYLNRKRDLNDIYIIVTLYQYSRNYCISTGYRLTYSQGIWTHSYCNDIRCTRIYVRITEY